MPPAPVMIGEAAMTGDAAESLSAMNPRTVEVGRTISRSTGRDTFFRLASNHVCRGRAGKEREQRETKPSHLVVDSLGRMEGKERGKGGKRLNRRRRCGGEYFSERSELPRPGVAVEGGDDEERTSRLLPDGLPGSRVTLCPVSGRVRDVVSFQ